MGLAEIRKASSMSQREVGSALGVSDAAVCQWETGKTFPRATLLRKLAELYGCTVDDLLREETNGAEVR